MLNYTTLKFEALNDPVHSLMRMFVTVASVCEVGQDSCFAKCSIQEKTHLPIRVIWQLVFDW